MKYFILKILIALSVTLTTMTSCHKQATDLNLLDLETLNFETDLELLLNSEKYILQEKSEVDDTSKYYSYNLDSLRYGDILFSRSNYNKYSRSKYGEQDDVFDIDENVNRLDIFPSPNGNGIRCVVLNINNERDTKELLRYINKNVDEASMWTRDHKTYLLKKEIWQIDDKEITTLRLIISNDSDFAHKIAHSYSIT